jgi:hypothetical protein
VINFNSAGLQWLLKEYVAYCERSRTHLALKKAAPLPRAVWAPGDETDEQSSDQDSPRPRAGNFFTKALVANYGTPDACGVVALPQRIDGQQDVGRAIPESGWRAG